MQIIPIASGKGGVGKSLLAANLAIALGEIGKKVVLVDLDLGASNLHLSLGQTQIHKGIGTYLTEKTPFAEIIMPTEYENLSFVAGDSSIPGLTYLKTGQKIRLVNDLRRIDADFLILDLGAGTHQIILDLFLQSPQGILVTSPTVTATLDGYLFLKNSVFRLLFTAYRKGTKGFEFLEMLKKNSNALKNLYIPRLIGELEKIDLKNTNVFKRRLAAFRPRLVLNMVGEPQDAERAERIRESAKRYLGLDLEYLGIGFTDGLQDKALASRLPIIIYKPKCALSVAIYRMAQKISTSVTRVFDEEYNSALSAEEDSSFKNAKEEAASDYALKLSAVDELISSGQLKTGDLIDMIKNQNYELASLKAENLMLRTRLLEAAKSGRIK